MSDTIRRCATAGLIVAVSTISAVVAIDVALRAIDYSPPVSLSWHFDAQTARVPNETLIMARPELLRDDFYTVDPSRETIVTLGDSFTEGAFTPREHSYPATLQRLLGEQGWAVNVLNAGVGNSGPDQHLRLLKEFILPRVTPDIVVWQLYQNDIVDNVQQAVYGVEHDALVPWSARDHWLYQRRRLYDSLPLPQSVKRSSPLVLLTFRALEAVGDTRVPSGDAAQREWGALKIRLEVEEMERLAAVHHFATYYVLVAPQGKYLEESNTAPAGAWSGPSKNAHERLEEILAERPDFINGWFGDTQTWPRDVDAGEVLTSAGLGADLFVNETIDRAALGHRHFNATGYSLLAHAVAARLLLDR